MRLMKYIFLGLLMYTGVLFGQNAATSIVMLSGSQGNYFTTLNGTNQTWQDPVPSGISFERTTAFSVVMYLKLNSVVGTNDIFIGCRKGNATLRGWSIQYTATNKITWALLNASSEFMTSTTNLSVFTVGKFFLLVGTYDGSSLNTGFKIYVDGANQAVTGANTLSATTVTDASFCIGSRDNTDRWANITVGVVQVISGYVLTQTDVTNIYNTFSKRGLPKSYPGGTIVASYNWKLSGKDISSTSNDLNGINTPLVFRVK